MASVNSPIRKLLKPLFYKLIPKSAYIYLQAIAKYKDIKGRLVEEEELAILPLILNKNSNSIDIGANFVYVTDRLAKISPEGQIYAFEPIPFTFKVAQKIIKKLKYKNVNLYNLGVGNENSEVTFEVPLQDFGAFSAGQAHLSGRKNEDLKSIGQYGFKNSEKVKCKIIRLDDFKDIADPIDFVKIDIEGAELYAIEGMKNLLLKYKPIIYMEVNPFFLKAFNISQDQLSEKINELGYEFYEYIKGKNKLKLISENFKEANYFLLHKDKKANFERIIM